MALVLVVGAGFSGSVAARELAGAGHRVVVAERRGHVGGNAYDERDQAGVLVHRYGPHIFHTNAARVWEYLSQFTAWRPYEHRVLASVDGQLLPLPINRTTINRLYGWQLTEAGVARHLRRVAVPRAELRTSEDVVLSRVGPDLAERFFRGYTRKQWSRDLSELGPGVAGRIPVRTTEEDRYFTDRWQAMPANGYAALFHRLLNHPRIELRLGTEGLVAPERGQAAAVVYTGPLDAYFDYRLGRLPYRSIRFAHEHLPGVAQLQPVATINYPGPEPFTRVTEFKHLTGQVHPGTSIVREYPTDVGDPYYPVPSPASNHLANQYRALAAREHGVVFLGRLAQYRYLNMDQAVAAALQASDRLRADLGARGGCASPDAPAGSTATTDPASPRPRRPSPG